MRDCIVDLRCLQDPLYRGRGIGRHAVALLGTARTMMPDYRIIGLTDPELPELQATPRAMVDAVRHSAYTGAMFDPCLFVQFSAMTHDPLFVARLLDHPEVRSAAVVYDFIPLEEPERYLPLAGNRLDYHVGLRWLARHDLFLPISADAANRLAALVGARGQRIVVTGAPLAPSFESLLPGTPQHILVVGGGDARKNPECAVRAHARSAVLQAARIPLVITGQYDAAWLLTQRDEVAALGGDPRLLNAPGHVNEAALHALYADAWCVVVPSRAEGFSLPVIEAMAAGVPVLASDIPAHRELLDRGLFSPNDDAALGRLLETALQPSWRTAALGRQAVVWPEFRADDVARRFWAAVSRLQPKVAPARCRGRPVVAFLTPLPPDRSGVADYSAATCAELGRQVDLHVFTSTVAAELPAGVLSINSMSALPLLASRFDRVIGVLGNSVFHIDILKLLLRYGGAAILHDGRLLDVYAGHVSLTKTVQMAEAEIGRRVTPEELRLWLLGDKSTAALILADVATSAEPLMMHSPAAIAEVGRRYGTAAVHLPFSVYRGMDEAALTPTARAAARHRLGVPDGDVLLASFGYVHPTKAPIDCIWALSLLRSWGVPARLHFVGSPLMSTEPLLELIEELALGDLVHLSSDFVQEVSYRDYLAGADIGIQLRPGGIGSVSGALSDCIAAGLRTVASAMLSDAVDAPDFVVAIPDNPSPVLIADAVMTLLDRPSATDARRDYVAGHAFDTYVARLCQALRVP